MKSADSPLYSTVTALQHNQHALATPHTLSLLPTRFSALRNIPQTSQRISDCVSLVSPAGLHVFT